MKERGGDDVAGATRSFLVGLVVRWEGHGGAWGIGRGEEGSERGGGDAERLFITRGMGIRVILLWDKLELWNL